MNIPKRYKIGGQWFDVKMFDLVDKGENHGTFQYGKPLISIATKCKDYDDETQLLEMSESQIKNTFYHELFHSFQYMGGYDLEERVASTFAAFMCEFDETKEYETTKE